MKIEWLQDPLGSLTLNLKGVSSASRTNQRGKC